MHLEVHRKDLQVFSSKTEAAFAVGHEVGDMAIRLYGRGEGVEVQYQNSAIGGDPMELSVFGTAMFNEFRLTYQTIRDRRPGVVEFPWVEIEDIALCLSRVARWNGQTSGKWSFSVAQHSLLVEDLVGRDLVLEGTERARQEDGEHDAQRRAQRLARGVRILSFVLRMHARVAVHVHPRDLGAGDPHHIVLRQRVIGGVIIVRFGAIGYG